MARRSVPTRKEYRLHLFGKFQMLERAEGVWRELKLPHHKIELLLACLALYPNPDGHARAKLAAQIWDESTDVQARASLRSGLAHLRRLLGENFLIADRESVQLNPGFPIWIDVVEFIQNRQAAPEAAVEVYRGSLLVDFYQDWVDAKREQLCELYVGTLFRLTQQLRAASDFDRAIQYAEKIIRVDPSNELAFQQLMFCEMARGNRAAALTRYAECERVLRAEIDVAPSDETRALYQWMAQTQTPQSLLPARITNLPIPATRFIGRKSEAAHIKQLLAQHRLITLVGAGGSGKTRLAIQVATEMLDSFRDGVWWIELAHLVDPSQVIQAACKTLGVSETPNQPLEETLANYLAHKHLLIILDNCEHLLDACARLAEMLLIHAPCPQIKILATSREPLDLAGECFWHVATLSVPSQYPTLEQMLLRFESVQLFVERAQAAQPNFKLTSDNAPAIVEICRHLDGIPLAIELAAARVTNLPIAEIAARIDDRFNLLTQDRHGVLPRQQTLRALIDWSYDLLSEDERVLFNRLCVFTDRFSIPAAEAIGADRRVNANQVLDLIGRLVAKSLLLVHVSDGESRYMMLETIRQYAREKLIASGEMAQTRERHYQWFANWLDQAERQTYGAEQLIWLELIQINYADLIAALVWARDESQDDLEKIWQMAGALARFWAMRGHWSEAREWLSYALKSNAVSAARARALMMYGEQISFSESTAACAPYFESALAIYTALKDQRGIALGDSYIFYFETDPQRCQHVFDHGLALAQELRDTWLIAAIHFRRAFNLVHLGKTQESKRLFEDSLYYARQANDRWLVSAATLNLGEAARIDLDFERAENLYAEAMELQRALGDKQGMAIASHNLGFIALAQHDTARAMELFKTSLALHQDLGRKRGVVEELMGWGCIKLEQGHAEITAQLFGLTDAFFASIGDTLDPADQAEFARRVAIMRVQLGDAKFDEAWNKGKTLTLEQAIDLATR